MSDFVRIAPTYLPPLGTPLYWRDELSGELHDAIHAFVGYGADKRNLPTFKQVVLTVAYLKYVIDAPCWRGDTMLDGLRAQAEELVSSKKCAVIGEWCDEINAWIMKCLEIGIDPL